MLDQEVLRAGLKMIAQPDQTDAAKSAIIAQRNETAAAFRSRGHLRNDGDAHAGGDEAKNRRELASLKNEIQMQPGTLAGRDDRIAEAVPLL